MLLVGFSFSCIIGAVVFGSLYTFVLFEKTIIKIIESFCIIILYLHYCQRYGILHPN